MSTRRFQKIREKIPHPSPGNSATALCPADGTGYKNPMSNDPKDDKSARDTHYATLRRAVRDAKRERGEIPTPAPGKRGRQTRENFKPAATQPDQVFLYGLHTVR